jgi:nitric oxide reductase NorQ protein
MQQIIDISPFQIDKAPYYLPVREERTQFEAAYAARLPVMLKGPTGCGKTRFVEHMAWRLGRPLITVACNEDTTASDLTGRFLLNAEGTYWQDGPLTVAARMGAICYLDEVVEARQDTIVAIHPLTDARRCLPLDKNNELLQAHPDFQLVISYNPGYQRLLKDLKPSTKQRFVAIDFHYPAPAVEMAIVQHESGVTHEMAATLVGIAGKMRNLKGHGLDEGASTRMLVYAGTLMSKGIPAQAACSMALVQPITDDPHMLEALHNVVLSFLG